MRLARFFALLLALAGPALAQTPPMEPAALVKGFYVADFNEESMPMSPRLARFYKAALANSKKLNEPVAGLDFSWVLNGQDSEEGTLNSVRIGEVKLEGAKATVPVTFRNGGPMELRFDLVRIDGKWLVDDIHSLKKPRWTISKMLDLGAKQK